MNIGKSKNFINTHRVSLKDLPPAAKNKIEWPWTKEIPVLSGSALRDAHWPKISIITPNYNYAHFLEETIRSVLLQEYPNIEYIIIDGGSTDDSVKIIKKYERWISYWETTSDKGSASAINRGFSKATGEIFAWLNSDDLLMPGCLKSVGKIMLKNPKVDFLYGDRINADAETNFIGVHFSRSIIGRFHWAHCSPLAQECCFWRRRLHEKVGKLREDIKTIYDHDLFMRMWKKKGRFLKTKNFLGIYRNHQATLTNCKSDVMQQEIQKMIREEGIFTPDKMAPIVSFLIRLQYRYEQLSALLGRRVSAKRINGCWIWAARE